MDLRVALYGAYNETPTGPSVVTEGVAGGLASHGLDVEILTTGVREDHPQENVSVTNLPGSVDSVRAFYKSKREIVRHVRSREEEFDIFHTLAGIIDGADVWTCQGIFADFDILFHCPHIIKSPRTFLGANVYSIMKSIGMYRTERLVSTSPLVHRQCERYLRLETDDVVPLGVRIDQRCPPNGVSDPVRVLFPGRIERKKGQNRVLRNLDPDAETYEVDIVGSIADESYFQEFHSSWKDRAHGHVSDEELAKFYARSDIVVMGSEHENFGLVAVEAIARGCALVITDLCGFATFDVAKPENGIFVVEDGSEAGETVEQLCGQRTEQLRESKRSAHELSRAFTWERTTEEYLDIYSDVVED